MSNTMKSIDTISSYIFSSLHQGFEITNSRKSRFFSSDIYKTLLIKSQFTYICKLKKKGRARIFVEDVLIVLGYLNVFLLTIHI